MKTGGASGKRLWGKSQWKLHIIILVLQREWIKRTGCVIYFWARYPKAQVSLVWFLQRGRETVVSESISLKITLWELYWVKRFHLKSILLKITYLLIFIYVYVYISEKAMAPHSSTLAWKIPWREEPGGLQSMGSLRVGYDWNDLAAATAAGVYIYTHSLRLRAC